MQRCNTRRRLNRTFLAWTFSADISTNWLFYKSLTKSFALTMSHYGDFLGTGKEGILPHHVPASDAWCGERMPSLWTAKPSGFYMASCCTHWPPFQLCFCPLKTTSLFSKRAYTGLGFTKGRTCPTVLFCQAVCWSIHGVLQSFCIVFAVNMDTQRTGLTFSFHCKNPSFVFSSCQVCEGYLTPESQAVFF